MPPMVGYAVTARIRCSIPSLTGHTYFERTDWWDHILNTPAPRVFVMQDVDERPGFGAFLGEVHTNILKALGCAGAVTNGAVRDLPAVEAIGIPLFAGGVAVSHAYAHFIDFGGEVEVGGLKVNPGDLLHGDRHGLISVPFQIAQDIPAVAAHMREIDQKIIAVCRSPEFSLEKLRAAIETYKSNSPNLQTDEAGDEIRN
jgi:regulator of RNase E activity RraA